MGNEKSNYDRPFIAYDEQINKLSDEYELIIEMVSIGKFKIGG